jgi:hypothetical protein
LRIVSWPSETTPVMDNGTMAGEESGFAYAWVEAVCGCVAWGNLLGRGPIFIIGAQSILQLSLLP